MRQAIRYTLGGGHVKKNLHNQRKFPLRRGFYLLKNAIKWLVSGTKKEKMCKFLLFTCSLILFFFTMFFGCLRLAPPPLQFIKRMIHLLIKQTEKMNCFFYVSLKKGVYQRKLKDYFNGYCLYSKIFWSSSLSCFWKIRLYQKMPLLRLQQWYWCISDTGYFRYFPDDSHFMEIL